MEYALAYDILLVQQMNTRPALKQKLTQSVRQKYLAVGLQNQKFPLQSRWNGVHGGKWGEGKKRNVVEGQLGMEKKLYK